MIAEEHVDLDWLTAAQSLDHLGVTRLLGVAQGSLPEAGRSGWDVEIQLLAAKVVELGRLIGAVTES